jgi:hypothetical protein
VQTLALGFFGIVAQDVALATLAVADDDLFGVQVVWQGFDPPMGGFFKAAPFGCGFFTYL